MASGFMFATGVENSYPTTKGGKHRVDEMEKCGHYAKWRQDFDCVQDLGLRFLRYGPPLHRTWLGDGRYDWEFTDQAFADLRRRGSNPGGSCRVPGCCLAGKWLAVPTSF